MPGRGRERVRGLFAACAAQQPAAMLSLPHGGGCRQGGSPGAQRLRARITAFDLLARLSKSGQRHGATRPVTTRERKRHRRLVPGWCLLGRPLPWGGNGARAAQSRSGAVSGRIGGHPQGGDRYAGPMPRRERGRHIAPGACASAPSRVGSSREDVALALVPAPASPRPVPVIAAGVVSFRPRERAAQRCRCRSSRAPRTHRDRRSARRARCRPCGPRAGRCASAR